LPTVFLVRHGQASFGSDDYDVLSALGEQQSKVLGDELRRRDVRVDRVWSGTLRRQRATAVACLAAADLDLEITQDRRWNEYDLDPLLEHYLAELNIPPAAAAASPREFQQLLERAMIAWSEDGASVGTAGTWADFCSAPWEALAEVFHSLGSGGTALVFTSGGVVSAICASLLGLAPRAFLAVNRTIVNASLTKVVSGRSGISLVSLNEHGHFEGANRELLSYR
jgi:broad specificity phosphatase PhoE